MKKASWFVLKLIVLLAFVFAVIMGLNYFNNGIKSKSGQGSKPLDQAGSVISVLNWNLGYAGLGKESDFIMDGGKNLRPPSKEIVLKNMRGIQDVLKAHKTDFVMFQEISEPDMLTLGVDLLAGMRESLSEYAWFFSNDMRTQFIPVKQALHHGLASFSRVKTAPVTLLRLPLEPTRLVGIIQRQYQIQAREFTDSNGNAWVLLNVHLSAFDEGGNIRMKQLKKVFEITDAYYAEGKHVVIGGDWNMQLIPTDFPHTTRKEDLFWLTIFPRGDVRPGWEIIIDESTPSVRTNERPYHKGENYTTIIDGFLVSPNVKTLSVQTLDTDFEFTDHQAVLARFTAKR